MDKGSYTFQALSSKYEDFQGPAFTIKVGGTELSSTKMPITSLEVELCADGSAGGCRFVVESLYDFAQAQWISNLARTIQVGTKLEVMGGYVKQELIFYGYVDEFSIEYSGSGPPRLTVTGIDGFGYLMSCRKPIYAGQKAPKKVVEEILNKAVSAGCQERDGGSPVRLHSAGCQGRGGRFSLPEPYGAAVQCELFCSGGGADF